MRVFHIHGEQFTELPDLPPALPPQGFIWIGTERNEFETRIAHVQAALQAWSGGLLVDLHVSDLLSKQLPSHYDYTSWYDVMVFRRLVSGAGNGTAAEADKPGTAATAREVLAAIDTSPVGFALFDRVLITVHPTACAVREHFAQRMAGMAVNSERGESRGSARLPTGPADLMLRMLNYMVDSYLDLRRVLTKQLDALQTELLAPGSRFDDWQVLLDSRNTLHLLEDTCEDQRAAVQEWIDALDEWPIEADVEKRRERDMLRVRSRDVLEHIERVLSHVRRLEHSAETAVQMHFSALSHRTNDIMRTLTVLTAIFLPLNLITGFWGMNFEVLPLIHEQAGAWGAVGLMAFVAVALLFVFRRKHYLSGRVR
ncbi:MAG TPA: magnesium transporter CorA family protein [Rubrivivax sp.]|nr:magnesium transporter CorA family protein [Rubrivivax sp.]